MKSKTLYRVLAVLAGFASLASAQNMAEWIDRNLKKGPPQFPSTDAPRFAEFQANAVAGDIDAQERVFALVERRVNGVYKPLDGSGRLLFSMRRPVRGYDTPSSNYALNLNELFQKTTDRVQINKSNFTVHSKSGLVLTVLTPKYSVADATVEVSDGSQTGWIHLAGLEDTGRRFYESALADQIFLSSREFVISSSDTRKGEAGREGDVKTLHSESGGRVRGAFSSTAERPMNRMIILENRGALPVDNLLVEYQSFVRQTVMRLPRDIPSDFRLVGCITVRSIGPGEKTELELPLPAVVMQRPEEVMHSSGEYSYFEAIPAGMNQSGEGRMDGVWVRVHRITPYGERLVREYKSAGVPPVAWETVAPVGSDIR